MSEEEKNMVKDRAPDVPESRGRISLMISCSSPAAAVAMLAVHAPLALAAYAAVSFTHTRLLTCGGLCLICIVLGLLFHYSDGLHTVYRLPLTFPSMCGRTPL